MPKKSVPLIQTLVQIMAIWIASDAGFYILLPVTGFDMSYSDAPIWIALYYFVWVLVSLNTFWHFFEGRRPVENKKGAYFFIIFSILCFAFFAIFIMPGLPSVMWTESWDPPELMVATPWYFLPKAIEIFLQQLLIAALVLAFNSKKFSLRTISYLSVLIFGGAHFILALGDLPLGYVVRFIISASVFGAIFPYLMLKVRNGFVYSYTLHWIYYAVTVVLAHTVSPYAI